MAIPKLIFGLGFLFIMSPVAYSAKVPLFLFGDSYLDVGNNNNLNTSNLFKANFPPYGETFFHHATGRYSNGRLIDDFIAEYANLPFIPAFNQPGNHELIYGVNFASSGSGALAITFPGLVISLQTQLKNFKNVKKQLVKKLGKKEANQLVANSVYLISVGTNDYLLPFLNNTTATFFQAIPPQEYVNMVVGNITSAIKKIYEDGGRKFGYINLGPLNCFPIIRALNPVKIGDCREELETLVNLHNFQFLKKMEKLEKELEGFKYSLFNLNAAATERINHPSKYGFKDSKSACCGSGPFRGSPTCGRGQYKLCEDVGDYLFWDFLHYTEKTYQQIAELMWTGILTTSHSLKALFEHTHRVKPTL